MSSRAAQSRHKADAPTSFNCRVGDEMTRKRLTFSGYRAVRVDACGEGPNQANVYHVYSHLRMSCYSKAKQKLLLGDDLKCAGNGRCEYQDRICRLFAINSGKGIPRVPLDIRSSPPSSSEQNKMVDYSFVLVTNGCELMDDCITQMEDELRLSEKEIPLGYNDEEIRWLIQSRMR